VGISSIVHRVGEEKAFVWVGQPSNKRLHVTGLSSAKIKAPRALKLINKVFTVGQPPNKRMQPTPLARLVAAGQSHPQVDF
jgi:hypothetical protein